MKFFALLALIFSVNVFGSIVSYLSPLNKKELKQDFVIDSDIYKKLKYLYSKEPSLKDFSLINIPIFLPLSQLTCSSLTGIKKTNIFKLLPAIKNCQKKSDLLISASKYNYSVFWSEGEITYSITGTNVAYTENFRKENLHKPTSSIDLQVGQTEMGFEGSFNKYGVSYALHSQCSQGNSKCSKKKLREQFKNLYSIITPAFEMLSFGRLLKP